MATDPQAADEDQSMTQGNTDATASQAESETKPQPAVLELKQPLPTNTTRTPEPSHDPQGTDSDTPSTPGQLAPFDWEDFEARYEAALREADDNEREILKEAESLSKYFQAWAAAASAHDDERAVKRLRTRQRFVNLSEEKASQKQKHYEEVVKAFESALALLQAK